MLRRTGARVVALWRRVLPRATGVLRPEQGFLLQWTVLVSAVGIVVALPVAVLSTQGFRIQGEVQDQAKGYYAAESAV